MEARHKAHQTDSRELLREMLLRLQDETYERVRGLRRDQEEESDAGPADEMDSARTSAEVETHAALIARAEEKLKFLDEALGRLDAGNYGRCANCRELIPLERLKALPFAAYCVDCQQSRNRAGRDWGEGKMIPPYDHQWTVPEEMAAAEREDRGTGLESQSTIDRGASGFGQPELNAPSISSSKKPSKPGTRRRK